MAMVMMTPRLMAAIASQLSTAACVASDCSASGKDSSKNGVAKEMRMMFPASATPKTSLCSITSGDK